MAWPTSTASTTTTDNDSDKISASRADINLTISNVNDIIGMFNIPATPTDNYILRYDSATSKFEVEALPASGGGGITEVVDDTSPQLGGSLDLNGFSIVTDSGDEDIILAPHGQGRVIIDNSTGSDRLQVSSIIPQSASSLFLHAVHNASDPPSSQPTVGIGVDNQSTPTKIIINHTLPVQVDVDDDDDYVFTCPVVFNDAPSFPSYTVSTLPGASTAGQMIFCSDETGGAVMLFSDGTNWRRVTDRAIAS
jgi:hypothetical protein